MKKYIVILLLSTTFNLLNAQITFQQKSYLNLRVHYISGDQTNRENYKWLNPDTGKDAFLYSSDIQVLNCDCPDDLSKGIEIFKSFTLLGKWFNLMGEFASNPGLMYEYKNDFSFVKNGVKYNINKKLLSKYPALLKRLKYASPTSFDYTLRFDAIANDRSVSGIELMVKDIDLLIPPENEMPYMVAGAPSKWNDRLIIGNYIKDNEIDNKKRWANLVEIKNNVSLVINKISIPVDELITIANLYKEYEKEDKILKDKYKIIEPEYKPAKATLPYTKADSWSKPYEPEIKTARAFNEYGKAGLKSGDKIVFVSDQYSRADSLSGSSKYFLFSINNKDINSGIFPLCEVFNAKGQKQTIGGVSKFLFVSKSKEDNGYTLVCDINKNRPPVYKSLIKYNYFIRSYWWTEEVFTAERIESAKRYDKDNYNEYKGPPNIDSSLLKLLRYFYIYEVDQITTDVNFRVIKTEKKYIDIAEKND
ncbi:hypothetical protein ACM55F_11630 [Flavobacterium sp. XS2P12]|uniref:hypothetical protein n=1 Tax=Flavobacterium melibiosi TaxID=3398734 RepID=UPI003A863667